VSLKVTKAGAFEYYLEWEPGQQEEEEAGPLDLITQSNVANIVVDPLLFNGKRVRSILFA